MRAGEIAQSVKGVPRKSEDLSLDPQNLTKKSQMQWHVPFIPGMAMLEEETKGSLESQRQLA